MEPRYCAGKESVPVVSGARGSLGARSAGAALSALEQSLLCALHGCVDFALHELLLTQWLTQLMFSLFWVNTKACHQLLSEMRSTHNAGWQGPWRQQDWSSSRARQCRQRVLWLEREGTVPKHSHGN